MDILFIFAWIMMIVLVGIMADKRDRNILGWCITSIFISPFFAALFLLALGPAKIQMLAEVQIPRPIESLGSYRMAHALGKFVSGKS